MCRVTEYKECVKCKEVKPLSEFSIFKSNKDGYERRCKICYSERRRHQANSKKLQLLSLNGDKCVVCGYDKCPAALEFHHKDPLKKDFPLSLSWKSLPALIKESKKCALLCSNCHREVHAGLLTL